VNSDMCGGNKKAAPETVTLLALSNLRTQGSLGGPKKTDKARSRCRHLAYRKLDVLVPPVVRALLAGLGWDTVGEKIVVG
jgi:hypothetical protein